jgi:hypothetical protein
VPLTRWPVRDLESKFTEGGGGGAKDISNIEEDLLANARAVGEVAPDLEQQRNDIVGDVENNLHARAE